jgi:hypothetical protein
MTLSVALVLSLIVGASAFCTPGQRQQSTRLQNDLWGQPPDMKDKEMSKALPFVPRPKMLDGELAGDVGFEYVISLVLSR